eukprot:CAMPEP_0179218596 /NCGR_PEP_ID=MMETSP0797-20121207/4554_1 /TAXON_ID=47934 /ORGANISM="Dinophysis acuminata, Strain DAEP01" /LENGTH=142 /DNA_ID=CAMNT_0020924947 /DNA_START=72 /DNA_END=500 /DNA_ORIENTATION=+
MCAAARKRNFRHDDGNAIWGLTGIIAARGSMREAFAEPSLFRVEARARVCRAIVLCAHGRCKESENPPQATGLPKSGTSAAPCAELDADRALEAGRVHLCVGHRSPTVPLGDALRHALQGSDEAMPRRPAAGLEEMRPVLRQ